VGEGRVCGSVVFGVAEAGRKKPEGRHTAKVRFRIELICKRACRKFAVFGRVWVSAFPGLKGETWGTRHPAN
jgi:hypothetical protein